MLNQVVTIIPQSHLTRNFVCVHGDVAKVLIENDNHILVGDLNSTHESYMAGDFKWVRWLPKEEIDLIVHGSSRHHLRIS